MHIIWGLLMVAIGLFMLVCASRKSDFIIYRLLFYRAKLLWGEKAHRFPQVSGVLLAIAGILVALGLF